ncbi:hypothetical protein PSY31_22855, partial [Shigella flexneri]|nr:hypothetical protein [Shigella flexneri]
AIMHCLSESKACMFSNEIVLYWEYNRFRHVAYTFGCSRELFLRYHFHMTTPSGWPVEDQKAN